MLASSAPVLWHLPTSHYSEKVRWALDHKQVRHARRVPLGGTHKAVAMALTGGRTATLPVLRMDGESVGDSTAIIAALEARAPEPPLYPGDPGTRARALELEDWFDEQLGPHIRTLALHELSHDREVLEQFTLAQAPAPLRRFPGMAAAGTAFFLDATYGVRRAEGTEEARSGILAAFDHLERELGDSGYLAGDGFSVADLTAAAHLYWLVQPPEGPRIVERLPAGLERFVAPLRERPGYGWVEAMYRRHRRPASPVRR